MFPGASIGTPVELKILRKFDAATSEVGFRGPNEIWDYLWPTGISVNVHQMVTDSVCLRIGKDLHLHPPTGGLEVGRIVMFRQAVTVFVPDIFHNFRLCFRCQLWFLARI